MNVATEKAGSRIYVTGNTFQIKSQLKSAGCHWDSDRKQWWIGTAKASKLESVLGSAEPEKEDLSTRRCDGKVSYKGRDYFVIGRSAAKGKLWLTVLDCKIDFWADESACTWVKHYQSRERYGREEYQTVGKIRDFIAASKSNETAKQTGNAETKRCWECGCSFTYHDARTNGGDWSDSYCGC